MGYYTRYDGSIEIIQPVYGVSQSVASKINKFNLADHRNLVDLPTAHSYFCDWDADTLSNGIRLTINEASKGSGQDQARWLQYLLEKHQLNSNMFTITGVVEWDGEESGDIGRITYSNEKKSVCVAEIKKSFGPSIPVGEIDNEYCFPRH